MFERPVEFANALKIESDATSESERKAQSLTSRGDP